MPLTLPDAPSRYDGLEQQRMRNALREADEQNFKKRADVLFVNGERVVLKQPNGTFRALAVDNAGVLTTVAYP
jgi:paraquat-inducible protein B